MLKIMFFCILEPLLFKIIWLYNKKIRENAGFITNLLGFHEKKLKAQKSDSENLLKTEPERIEAVRNSVQWHELNGRFNMYSFTRMI